ncbi:MAG TPA: DinB family protein [Armatimonadota bacterium]|nr:DinB family protein [Armatimonadota bacterium]
MAIRDGWLVEWDVEGETTRRILARVPGDALAYTPHAKSPTMGWLANHLALLPRWGIMTLTTTELDLALPEMQQHPVVPDALEEILATFDEHAAAFRAVLAQQEDEAFMVPWTMRMGPEVIFTQPRSGVLRGMIFNHLVHHRAQLGVYLRLNNVPVPFTYGPTADESPM